MSSPDIVGEAWDPVNKFFGKVGSAVGRAGSRVGHFVGGLGSDIAKGTVNAAIDLGQAVSHPQDIIPGIMGQKQDVYHQLEHQGTNPFTGWSFPKEQVGRGKVAGDVANTALTWAGGPILKAAGKGVTALGGGAARIIGETPLGKITSQAMSEGKLLREAPGNYFRSVAPRATGTGLSASMSRAKSKVAGLGLSAMLAFPSSIAAEAAPRVTTSVVQGAERMASQFPTSVLPKAAEQAPELAKKAIPTTTSVTKASVKVPDVSKAAGPAVEALRETEQKQAQQQLTEQPGVADRSVSKSLPPRPISEGTARDFGIGAGSSPNVGQGPGQELRRVY